MKKKRKRKRRGENDDPAFERVLVRRNMSLNLDKNLNKKVQVTKDTPKN